MKTVLIADDHEIVRRGVRMSIEGFAEQYHFIEASTCAMVKEILSSQQVHYAILDMFLADANVFSLIQLIAEQSERVGFLVYTMSSERIYAKRFIEKGVRGFVSKRSSIDELEAAIKTVFNGEIYLSAGLKETLFNSAKFDPHRNPIDLLSDRELEVVDYMVMGMGAKEISQRMNVDSTTISTYRRRAFEKLDVQNTIELKEKIFLYKQ